MCTLKFYPKTILTINNHDSPPVMGLRTGFTVFGLTKMNQT